MAYFKNTELLPERRVIVVSKSLDQSEQKSRAYRRGRRCGRISRQGFLFWLLSLGVLLFMYLAYFGLKMHFHGVVYSLRDVKEELLVKNATELARRKPHRQRFSPCEVPFLDSVTYLLEPKDNVKFAHFSLGYMEREEKTSLNEPRFGGHQTLEEREESYHARNRTIYCGFVSKPNGFPSAGFDVDKKDKKYMHKCIVVVSSCIFGGFDFLRRPTSKVISEYSKKNVCFVMFVDEESLVKLSADGNIPDENGNVGLWRIVIVKSLPYEDMRKTGKVPKFLSHRLFPSSRYSIWLDSKLRLNADPMQIIEYFLWRAGSEYAISNHYARHCVWEEVLQNKRLNKYNHSAIDEQFHFYQSDGLTKFDSSDPQIHLPSFVPEGSFIVRAHTPMSNLFSCLWFNEIDHFTSRDQLSFAYTYLKLRRLNPNTYFYLNMFKVVRYLLKPLPLDKFFNHISCHLSNIIPSRTVNDEQSRSCFITDYLKIKVICTPNVPLQEWIEYPVFRHKFCTCIHHCEVTIILHLL